MSHHLRQSVARSGDRLAGLGSRLPQLPGCRQALVGGIAIRLRPLQAGEFLPHTIRQFGSGFRQRGLRMRRARIDPAPPGPVPAASGCAGSAPPREVWAESDPAQAPLARLQLRSDRPIARRDLQRMAKGIARRRVVPSATSASPRPSIRSGIVLTDRQHVANMSAASCQRPNSSSRWATLFFNCRIVRQILRPATSAPPAPACCARPYLVPPPVRYGSAPCAPAAFVRPRSVHSPVIVVDRVLESGPAAASTSASPRFAGPLVGWSSSTSRR